MGALRTFFGTSGPDGLVVAHASLGGAFLLNARGKVTHFVRSPVGYTVTNVAFRPGTSQLVLTESQTGTVLEADLPCRGAAKVVLACSPFDTRIGDERPEEMLTSQGMRRQGAACPQTSRRNR